MVNRKFIIGKISKLNTETIGTRNTPTVIRYLDTSSITRNRIENIQILDSRKVQFPSRAQRKVKNETIIYSTVRPDQEHFGFLQNPQNDLIVSTGFTTIDVIDKDIDPKFLYYSLTRKDITRYLNTIATNNVSAYPSLNPSDIGNLELECPDNKIVQQKIASVLSALDSKIDLNNRINAELEQMAKTLYDYWFVQFDFPDKNGKPYKQSGGKMVYNTELKREIPEGWEVKTVGSILERESALEKIQSSAYLKEGSFPIIDQSTDYIAGYTNDKNSVIHTEVPRIVFGDHTRILKLINFDFARGADGTQILLSNSKRIPQHLFFQVLLKIDLSNYGYARHFKYLKDSKIVIPQQEVPEKYEIIAKNSYDLIKHNIFENQSLSALRDWLLPMLMNGQVAVK